jgi:hypothetical protein
MGSSEPEVERMLDSARGRLRDALLASSGVFGGPEDEISLTGRPAAVLDEMVPER